MCMRIGRFFRIGFGEAISLGDSIAGLNGRGKREREGRDGGMESLGGGMAEELYGMSVPQREAEL